MLPSRDLTLKVGNMVLSPTPNLTCHENSAYKVDESPGCFTTKVKSSSDLNLTPDRPKAPTSPPCDDKTFTRTPSRTRQATKKRQYLSPHVFILPPRFFNQPSLTAGLPRDTLVVHQEYGATSVSPLGLPIVDSVLAEDETPPLLLMFPLPPVRPPPTDMSDREILDGARDRLGEAALEGGLATPVSTADGQVSVRDSSYSKETAQFSPAWDCSALRTVCSR